MAALTLQVRTYSVQDQQAATFLGGYDLLKSGIVFYLFFLFLAGGGVFAFQHRHLYM